MPRPILPQRNLFTCHHVCWDRVVEGEGGGGRGGEWVTGCPNFMPLAMATACCISNQFSSHVLWRITKMKLNLGWPKTLLKSFSQEATRQTKQNNTKLNWTEPKSKREQRNTLTVFKDHLLYTNGIRNQIDCCCCLRFLTFHVWLTD